MTTLKTTFQSYWASRKIIQSEENTVLRLDTTNGTKYLKQFKKGLITAEEVASRNHNDGLGYEVTILKDDKPNILIHVVHENEFIGVDFIDEQGRKYLAYHFFEVEPLKRLFLGELWYYNFPDEDVIEEDYRIHMVFEQDGSAAYRKYDEVNKKTIDYESIKHIDLSGLYEDYPEFGHYESIIRFERDIDPLREIMKRQ